MMRISALQNKRLELKEIPKSLRVFQYFIIPTLLLIIWEISVRVGILPSTLIAAPTKVVSTFFSMMVDFRLIENSLVSLGRLLSGFFLGSSLGISIGILVGHSKIASRLLEPTVLTLIPVPPIAWIPLLIILFGIGEASKIILVSIGSFCTLFIHAAYGVRSADKSLVEVAYVLEKDNLSTLFNVLIPSSLPTILSSMRVAMALSWTLLVSSEVIASSKGLGWLIWDSRNFARPDEMIAGMVAVGLLGKSTDAFLVFLEQRLTGWRQTYRDI